MTKSLTAARRANLPAAAVAPGHGAAGTTYIVLTGGRSASGSPSMTGGALSWNAPAGGRRRQRSQSGAWRSGSGCCYKPACYKPACYNLHAVTHHAPCTHALVTCTHNAARACRYARSADATWGGARPSLQEARVHAKCLRSLPLVRNYFRNYRAKKKVGRARPAGSACSSMHTAAMICSRRRLREKPKRTSTLG